MHDTASALFTLVAGRKARSGVDSFLPRPAGGSRCKECARVASALKREREWSPWQGQLAEGKIGACRLGRPRSTRAEMAPAGAAISPAGKRACVGSARLHPGAVQEGG